MKHRTIHRLVAAVTLTLCTSGVSANEWTKHVIHSGFRTNTAIAADFTADGKVDVISASGGKVRLFVGPDWREISLLDSPGGRDPIHSEIIDLNGDGRLDYIGAIYQPGHILALLQPRHGAEQEWQYVLVDDKVNGIHGLLRGDVNRDGRLDLIANSAQPVDTDFPESIVWYDIKGNADGSMIIKRHVFADKDAPGLSHYMGFGDVDGDGRPDIAAGAKGDPAPPGTGDWFAWWKAPADPTRTWSKNIIAAQQIGATNIHPADVNGDGRMDFIASRGHGKGLVWFEGPNWTPHEINPDLTGPHCLTVIDMDGDGDIDAATCAKDDRIAAWFENDGEGNFKTRIVGRNQAAYDIRAVDMDGDGDLDLLVAGQFSENVVWYENPLK